MKTKLNWKPFMCSPCPNCGKEDSEVLTKSKKEKFVYDGEEARCKSCGMTGYVEVSDVECADIVWNDEDDSWPTPDF